MNGSVLAAVVAASVATSTIASAQEWEAASFRDRTLGVTVEVPQGWLLVRQTAYPPVLAHMIAPARRATITIARGDLGPKESLAQFAAKQNEAMRRVGLHVTGKKRGARFGLPSYEVLAQNGQATTVIRQVYLRRGVYALIMVATLAVPIEESAGVDLCSVATNTIFRFGEVDRYGVIWIGCDLVRISAHFPVPQAGGEARIRQKVR